MEDIMARLTIAKELLEDAKLCLDHGRFRSTVSRAYYAAFHACVALFEHYGYRPSNFIGRDGRPATRWEHGIITKHFHTEFVHKRGIIEWRMGVELRRLYRSRIQADYRADMVISPSLGRESYDWAVRIIAAIEGRVG